ncbi:PREDICTED: odorant receptor 4-like [Papilio polytes]|uniref:odorant receptor 4-like n=1 Tax=Papilio polytes TaxID=76194 RepID=UPI00067645AA|nr:PREDICTED: odorant receptor 4-like [Papilio polytes]
MDALLFDESLNKISFLFRYGGLSLASRTRTTTQTVKIRLLYLFNSFWLNVDLAGGIYWFIDGLKNGKSFIELTYIAPCIALAFMANIKSLFMIVNETRIDEMIDILRSLEVTVKNSKRVESKEEIVAREKSFLYCVIKMLNILNVVVVLTFSISPFVLMLIKYMKIKELELMLPFFIIYPFDSYDIRYWPFAYLHQFWSEWVVILDICSADYFFFTCCSHIRTQFLLLAYDLENIIPDLDNSITQTADIAFNKKFVEIIRRHQVIIGAARLLEAIYTKSTLYNFTSSSILICLTGFNVVAIEDVALIVTFLLFLSMCLLQVFFLCFFGDMLMRSSMKISNAAYNSRWYSADPVIAKSFLIVLTRAQKPCKLTAMGFADVNLMAFTSVLSTSWSYFCLLNTMYKPSSV